jgi:hypothetical protein
MRLFAYTDSYRRKDVLHAFPDLRQALMLEAALSLNISSLTCICSFWCDSDTCIDRMRSVMWLREKR